MKTEFYIARRLSSRRGGAKAGVMERVATIATAVSIAVIVVTLSVVVGFKHNLASLMSSASSDIVLTAPASRGVVSGVLIERSTEVEQIATSAPHIRITPYTAKEGVLKSEDNIMGVMLKGVDKSYDSSFYEEHMVEGCFPRIGLDPRRKDIALSQRVAEKMEVGVGDRIEMVFIDDEGGVLRDRFEISGLYCTGVDIIDLGYVFTDMRNVARLYDGSESMITGYEMWLEEGADAQIIAEVLNDKFIDLYLQGGQDVEAFTMQDIYPNIFGWLATHDVTAQAVVVIMIIVALLNMTTSLLIIVLERQRMIGELRAMGMRRGAVLEIFLFRALFIFGRGVAWGVVVGVVCAALQHIWAIVPLPAEGYILDAVPAAMCWGWWAMVIIGVVVVTLLFMMLPAAFATRISPANTMRYES
ncbi:MAG: ABC transporter permease [Alistipes sp.]|nr:ABC transporter permease [Alistipes sp.]